MAVLCCNVHVLIYRVCMCFVMHVHIVLCYRDMDVCAVMWKLCGPQEE